MKFFLILISITWTLLLIVTPVMAIDVQIPNPIFAPSGTNANKNIFVENKTPTLKAVEVFITHREHDINGKETRKDADSDWEVFPSQIILNPGEEKVVTIRYVATQNIKKEIPYRVIVEEIPIDLPDSEESSKTGSQVNMILKFVKSIYVQPKGTSPRIVMSELELTKKEDGKRYFDFVISNRGSEHEIIKSGKIEFFNNEKKVVLLYAHEQIPNINFLAGDKRRISLPVSDEFQGEIGQKWPGTITYTQ